MINRVGYTRRRSCDSNVSCLVVHPLHFRRRNLCFRCLHRVIEDLCVRFEMSSWRLLLSSKYHCNIIVGLFTFPTTLAATGVFVIRLQPVFLLSTAWSVAQLMKRQLILTSTFADDMLLNGRRCRLVCVHPSRVSAVELPIMLSNWCWPVRVVSSHNMLANVFYVECWNLRKID